MQVGFEPCAIVIGMLEDQLNEAPLACSKVSLNTSVRQAMEDRHWLLGEELFKFVGGHFTMADKITG